MSVSDITPKRPKQMTDERLAELMAMAVPLWVHELFDHIAWQAGEIARLRSGINEMQALIQAGRAKDALEYGGEALAEKCRKCGLPLTAHNEDPVDSCAAARAALEGKAP